MDSNIIEKKKQRKVSGTSRERHETLPEEEKEKRQKNTWDRYKNLSEEEKEKKVEYMRYYYLANKK